MWRTVVKEQDFVNIRFQEIGFDPNNIPYPIGDLIPIADSVLNITDTVTFNYRVDTLLQGKTGIFIVKSIIAEDVFDFTSILNIKPLVVNLTNYPQNLIRRVGDTISIWGETACFDSLAIEWSVDS